MAEADCTTEQEGFSFTDPRLQNEMIKSSPFCTKIRLHPFRLHAIDRQWRPPIMKRCTSPSATQPTILRRTCSICRDWPPRLLNMIRLEITMRSCHHHPSASVIHPSHTTLPPSTPIITRPTPPAALLRRRDTCTSHASS